MRRIHREISMDNLFIRRPFRLKDPCHEVVIPIASRSQPLYRRLLPETISVGLCRRIDILYSVGNGVSDKSLRPHLRRREPGRSTADTLQTIRYRCSLLAHSSIPIPYAPGHSRHLLYCSISTALLHIYSLFSLGVAHAYL